MLVVPFGLPVALLGLHAWRRALRWPLGAALAVSVLGFAVWGRVALDYPGGPPWLPLLFAPPILGAALALLLPRPSTRVAALCAALVPAAGGVAYGVVQGLAATPCPL